MKSMQSEFSKPLSHRHSVLDAMRRLSRIAIGFLAASGASLAQAGSIDVNAVNITVNGSVVESPAFVAAADLVTLDAVMTQTGQVPGTGLGLCLEYPRALADVQIADLYLAGYIGKTVATPIDCGYSRMVPGADSALITAWLSVVATWPGVPLPLKLYQAKLTIARTPLAPALVGFTFSGLPSQTGFTSRGDVTFCGKPSVKIAPPRHSDESPMAWTFDVTLSQPIPYACGTAGAFPVTLALADTVAAGATISGSRVSANGRLVTLMYPPDGQTTTLTVVVTTSQSLTGIDVFSLQPGSGNYLDGSTQSAPTSLTHHSLRITMSGSGKGRVVSPDMAGLECASSCEGSYAQGTTITLNPVADPGYQFVGWLGDCTGACVVTLGRPTSVIATFAPVTMRLNVDIDGSGTFDGLTDGILVLRYLHGLVGSSLIDNLNVTDSAKLYTRLEDSRPLFDIDGDGQVQALTDGVMLLRYLFGLRGPSLIANTIAPGAKRTTAVEIESVLRSVMR